MSSGTRRQAELGSTRRRSSVGPGHVDGEVDGPQLVGREGAGVLDGPGRGQVELVDEDEHDVAAQDRRGGRLRGVLPAARRPRSTYWRLRRSSSSTSTGTATMITQPPSANLVTAMMTSTTSDSTAPMPLMNSPVRQPGSRWVEVVLGHARPATA